MPNAAKYPGFACALRKADRRRAHRGKRNSAIGLFFAVSRITLEGSK
jgi:hypothetical protein